MYDHMHSTCMLHAHTHITYTRSFYIKFFKYFRPRSYGSIHYMVLAIRYTICSPPQTKFKWCSVEVAESRLWRRRAKHIAYSEYRIAYTSMWTKPKRLSISDSKIYETSKMDLDHILSISKSEIFWLIKCTSIKSSFSTTGTFQYAESHMWSILSKWDASVRNPKQIQLTILLGVIFLFDFEIFAKS